MTAQMRVNPMLEDTAIKDMGVAVPAGAAAPEEACRGRIAETGSCAPRIAEATEACKKTRPEDECRRSGGKHRHKPPVQQSHICWRGDARQQEQDHAELQVGRRGAGVHRGAEC